MIAKRGRGGGRFHWNLRTSCVFSQRMFTIYMYMYIFYLYFFFTWENTNCFSFCNSDCASSLLAMEVCLRISAEVLPLTYVARVINKRRHKVTLIRKWGVEVCLASAPLGIEPACRFEKRVYDHQDLQAVPDMSYYQGSYAHVMGDDVGELGPTTYFLT